MGSNVQASFVIDLKGDEEVKYLTRIFNVITDEVSAFENGEESPVLKEAEYDQLREALGAGVGWGWVLSIGGGKARIHSRADGNYLAMGELLKIFLGRYRWPETKLGFTYSYSNLVDGEFQHGGGAVVASAFEVRYYDIVDIMERRLTDASATSKVYAKIEGVWEGVNALSREHAKELLTSLEEKFKSAKALEAVNLHGEIESLKKALDAG